MQQCGIVGWKEVVGLLVVPLIDSQAHKTRTVWPMSMVIKDNTHGVLFEFTEIWVSVAQCSTALESTEEETSVSNLGSCPL